jgi:hypothetical protein
MCAGIALALRRARPREKSDTRFSTARIVERTHRLLLCRYANSWRSTADTKKTPHLRRIFIMS